MTSVKRLKAALNIPHEDALDQELDGKSRPIEDDGESHIRGGESFTSHKRVVRVEIDGTHHETHWGENTVEHLKRIGRVPEHNILGEIKDGKLVQLGKEAIVFIHGGEVFTSHKSLVKITINNKPHETHPGENSVGHLRRLGQVPADEILSEFKNGQFLDLADGGSVEIHGGEIFASHRPSGGSS